MSAESFERFYQATWRQALYVAMPLVRSHAEAEEVVQEAFLAAWRRWSEVSVMDAPKAWVLRVVTNRSVSRFRKLQRGRLFGSSEHVSHDDGVAERLVVAQALSKLPTRQRQAIVLHYFGDLSVKDCGNVMECGEETVKTHLERGRAHLRRLL